MRHLALILVLAASSAVAGRSAQPSLFADEWTRLAGYQAAGYLEPMSCETRTTTVAVCERDFPRDVVRIPSVGHLQARYTYESVGAKKPGGHLEYFVPCDGKRVYLTGSYHCSLAGNVSSTGWLKLTQTNAMARLGWSRPGQGVGNLVRTELLWKGPVPALRAPADGAVLTNNVPTFAWWPEAPGAVVEIAADPGFGKIVRTLETDEMPAVGVREPLEPGRYFWRVRLPLAATSETRSFRQVASIDADTSGPVLRALPQFFAERTKRPVFTATDAGRVVRTSARLEDGTALRISASGTQYKVWPPADGWRDGFTKIRVSAADEGGNVSEADLFLMVQGGLEKIVWDECRGFRIGEAGWRYPVGCYTVHDPDDAAKFASWGVNFVQSYQRDGKLPPGPGSQFEREMDAIGRLGMKTMLSLGGISPRKVAGVAYSGYEALARRLGLVIGRTEVAAWYLVDEPDIGGNRPTPVQARRMRELAAALDPTRPGLLICSGDSAASAFAPACSVYMSEAYSITVPGAWEKFASIRGKLKDKPRFNCINLARTGADDPYALKLDPRFPRNRQILSIALAAMMNGSGVMHYWWPRTKWNDAEGGVEEYFREVVRLSKLFAVVGERKSWSDGPLRVMEIDSDGQRLFVAANVSSNEVKIADGRVIEPWGRLLSRRPIAQDPRSVVCEGVYESHLQGVDSDGESLYWSFTRDLVKTDAEGTRLQSVRVPSHHGDLCVRDGTVYVAVNLGRFNAESGADSWVYAYSCRTLSPVGKWKLPEVVHGAGGITWRGDRFFVVGGLPSEGHDSNYVYEYDARFRFMKRHELKTGATNRGIQTAYFDGERFHFCCYGMPGEADEHSWTCPAALDSWKKTHFGGTVGALGWKGGPAAGRNLRFRRNGKNWNGGRIVPVRMR